ncbi:hypothetical protein [Actinotalea sp. K2]|uniref:hypothetical protein n=1 Tax=Actinotalea sp. K2 TaxID=2939438 RepID=UPI0020175B6B|nr:hypothetical protein [Actinotalea sp. K2]MCL3861558.1 hypothetical protein [Actinotalea sp. K2]
MTDVTMMTTAQGASIVDIRQRQLRRGERPWIAGLLMVSAAFIGLTFAPAFSGTGVALRFAAGVAVFTALVLAVHELRVRDQHQGHGRRGSLLANATKLTASFAIGALAIYGVVEATAPDASNPETFDLTIRDEAFSMVPATQITFEPNEAQYEASLIEAAETAEEFVEVTGRPAERLVAAAIASGYQSRSGHELNWDAAAVQAYRGIQLITVPLAGNVLDGVSKVVFMHQRGTTSVVEMTAVAVDLATFHLNVWQDGALRQNVDITNSQIVGGQDIVQAFSWSELNRCLSNAGIAWWILSSIAVVCAAVCVGTAGFGCAVCIAGLAGGHGGMAAACVKRANAA